MQLDKYKTLVFDCDGVILNSNKLKTEAFYQAALPYGETQAQALVDYHVQRGGISRYRKFEYFLEHILGVAVDPQRLDELLESYAAIVRDGLMTCELAPGLQELRQATPHARWLVVSGGDQSELRQVFGDRGLDQFFDGGIFGSPDTKEVIFARELGNANIIKPAVFFGDSQYDYLAASSMGLDFIFLSQWTELQDWQLFCNKNQILYYSSLNDFRVCKAIVIT